MTAFDKREIMRLEKELELREADTAQLSQSWNSLMRKYLEVRDNSFITILEGQWAFSQEAFGPGFRWKGVVDHIRKELVEVEKDPADVKEWIDIAILALDGACRTGKTPEEVAKAYVAKIEENKKRTWPDWRTADPNKAIEHVRKK